MPYTGVHDSLPGMRFRAAYPHVRRGSRVCDLGWGLDYAADRIAMGVGVDDQVEGRVRGRWQRGRADLRAPLAFPDGHFDHVVMLAVLEHLTELEKALIEAYRVIAPQGSLILTWPSATVDPILRVLHTPHLVSDETESDEHQKRIPVETSQQMLERIGFQKFVLAPSSSASTI
jgi:SAM-dependent methyltransferase